MNSNIAFNDVLTLIVILTSVKQEPLTQFFTHTIPHLMVENLLS